MDARALTAANRDAMAMVFVEFPGGRVVTGTAFAVRSDPTGGLLLTNKHVVVATATAPSPAGSAWCSRAPGRTSGPIW